MLLKAKYVAKDRGINLIQMDAENLDFKDNTFDTVIVSFVFCSLPDSVKGFQEIRRILKPEGAPLSIEHVLPENRFLRWLFNR
jgi:ubiquinone/menaquinone biosynthesis C-methylase UbiE